MTNQWGVEERVTSDTLTEFIELTFEPLVKDYQETIRNYRRRVVHLCKLVETAADKDETIRQLNEFISQLEGRVVELENEVIRERNDGLEKDGETVSQIQNAVLGEIMAEMRSAAEGITHVDRTDDAYRRGYDAAVTNLAMIVIRICDYDEVSDDDE